MIVTTTNNIEGHRITRYHGIVSGETVVGTNIFRDILAGITDLVGGRSGGYEKELRTAKEMAIEEMSAEARTLGADAVVGVDRLRAHRRRQQVDADGDRKRNRGEPRVEGCTGAQRATQRAAVRPSRRRAAVARTENRQLAPNASRRPRITS